MDATLKSLAGFDPIEQPDDPEPDTTVTDEEINELARRVERKIAETEERIEEIPDYPPRPTRVGGTIDVDTLTNA